MEARGQEIYFAPISTTIIFFIFEILLQIKQVKIFHFSHFLGSYSRLSIRCLKSCLGVRGFKFHSTLYQTGFVASHNGLPGFIMAGKKKKTGYTDKFLVENGCEVGSTFVMRDSTYMCDVSWEELTPHFIRGYCAMQHVCDNPNWWMLEIVDGSSSHVNTLEALKVSVISPGI